MTAPVVQLDPLEFISPEILAEAPNRLNPYPNRDLPVGRLNYQSRHHPEGLHKLMAMLEYGEIEFLFDIAVLVGPGAYVNIGEGYGGSAAALALGMKNRGFPGMVYSVDLYAANHPGYLGDVRANYTRWGCADRIDNFDGGSQAVAAGWLRDGLSFRFVFIDGSHEYKDVVEDLKNFSKMVKVGGWLALHDTNQDEVDRALQETLSQDPRWELVHWVNRIKAFKLKP